MLLSFLKVTSTINLCNDSISVAKARSWRLQIYDPLFVPVPGFVIALISEVKRGTPDPPMLKARAESAGLFIIKFCISLAVNPPMPFPWPVAAMFTLAIAFWAAAPLPSNMSIEKNLSSQEFLNRAAEALDSADTPRDKLDNPRESPRANELKRDCGESPIDPGKPPLGGATPCCLG